MSRSFSRRRFLTSTVAGSTFLGLSDLSFLSGLPRVSAEETRVNPNIVRLHPEIEPLVRLLEDTPRDRLLEEVAARIRRGLTYRQVVAALLLAGVRNIQPRPVGFKFHAVLVVNSAHLASLSSPEADRWLPIFWALDHFKGSQAQDVKEGNWTMPPVDEKAVPPARKAREMFMEAMDKWDEAKADAAVAGLARSAGSHEIFEIFARYGARDFRDIGHKAIYVANSWRTLQCIGWHHAEPVLRSLAYGLLDHRESQNPGKSDLSPDRPWRRNQELAPKIRPDWQEGKPSPEATNELIATLRQGSGNDACDQVVALLNRGVAPQSVWDALFAAAAELVMRQPAIVPLHAVTSTNALRFAYETSGHDETRRLLLLQNAAFVVLFREAMSSRGAVADHRIDQIEASPLKTSGPQALEEIFADVSRDRLTAARKTLAYLKDQPNPKELIDAARVLIFLKGDDSHDYKYSSALLEDHVAVSTPWRDRYLAAGTFLLNGARLPDNPLVKRTREALKA